MGFTLRKMHGVESLNIDIYWGFLEAFIIYFKDIFS